MSNSCPKSGPSSKPDSENIPWGSLLSYVAQIGPPEGSAKLPRPRALFPSELGEIEICARTEFDEMKEVENHRREFDSAPDVVGNTGKRLEDGAEMLWTPHHVYKKLNIRKRLSLDFDNVDKRPSKLKVASKRPSIFNLPVYPFNNEQVSQPKLKQNVRFNISKRRSLDFDNVDKRPSKLQALSKGPSFSRLPLDPFNDEQALQPKRKQNVRPLKLVTGKEEKENVSPLKMTKSFSGDVKTYSTKRTNRPGTPYYLDRQPFFLETTQPSSNPQKTVSKKTQGRPARFAVGKTNEGLLPAILPVLKIDNVLPLFHCIELGDDAKLPLDSPVASPSKLDDGLPRIQKNELGDAKAPLESPVAASASLQALAIPAEQVTDNSCESGSVIETAGSDVITGHATVKKTRKRSRARVVVKPRQTKASIKRIEASQSKNENRKN